MMQSVRAHGCALCGGDISAVHKSYILKVGRFKLLLDDLEVGGCEQCGEEYHLPVTSEKIDAEIQVLLNKGLVSTEEVENMDLIDTEAVTALKPEPAPDWLQAIYSRLSALEQEVQHLKAALQAKG